MSSYSPEIPGDSNGMPPRLSLAVALTVLFLFGSPSWGKAQEPESINPTINPRVDPIPLSDVDDQAAKLPRKRFDLASGELAEVAERLLAEMTLQEKIGQLCQVGSAEAKLDGAVGEDLRSGRVGSVFYTGNAAQTREAKRLALEESRLGVPLLTPRDVIHGFRTVFPIPLGQAASWNPELAEQAAVVAADEARAEGVNWTFAPMLDIARDARWGRIAESLGEDPVLGSALATAMVRGYQQPVVMPNGETRFRGIAACAKHFAAYGLSEGGRDYNRAQVAVSELHSAILPPFRAAIDAGCVSVMTSFNTINGVPGSAHQELLKGLLKHDWGFDGLVVSDWGSVIEMIEHGFAADRREAAEMALLAGLDMEMASTTFRQNLAELVEAGAVEMADLDEAVLRVLKVKLQFATEARRPPSAGPTTATTDAAAVARRMARESCVLLKNERGVLPLNAESLSRIAVVGPLADAGRDQLGCWMLDGKPEESVTPLSALRSALEGKAEVEHVAALESSLDTKLDGLKAAKAAAEKADLTLVFVGEGWRLSGEARSRAKIDLPGAQPALVQAVAETGKPFVIVVLSGRPLTIGEEIGKADAVLYAWHPGTQGGPAIADLLLGAHSPSGKLPVTFPKEVGQSPLYYNHPNTGRPPVAGTRALFGSGRVDFPEKQKYRSHYLDVDPFPLFPFGYGLSYTSFEYGEPELSKTVLRPGQTLGVRCSLTNTGETAADEVAQLYVRDVAASIVRPVRELKAFRRVHLEPGETKILEFALNTDDLGYFDNEAEFVVEPGDFQLGVGADSSCPLLGAFEVQPAASARNPASQAPRRK